MFLNQRSRRNIPSRRDRWEGTPMTNFFNRPLFGRHNAPASAGDARDDQVEGAEAPIPFAGYDRLDNREAMDELSDHSQTELEAAESYERTHKNRHPVLDKLRYMRGREPLPGYDDLSIEEVVTALQEADLATIKRVRGYERKFARRPDVLEEVARVHHRRRETEPTSESPGYEPLGGAIASSAPVDRPEPPVDRDDRPNKSGAR